MKRFSNLFIRGLVTLLPFGLTVFVLGNFLVWSENLSKTLISVISPDLYFPGVGPLTAVLLICLLGYLTTLKFMGKILSTLELPFKNVPIVKSIYSAVKSLSDYFSSGDKETDDQQVVVVRIPDFGAEILGLVTRNHLNDMPTGFTKEGRVSVFVPLSYQIGGLTMFVPKGWVSRVDMSVEDAMKSALTAWMPEKKIST